MSKPNTLVAFVLICAAALAGRAQDRDFITVAGASLRARLDAARRSGSARARQQPRFWAAYSFGVRPGVAVWGSRVTCRSWEATTSRWQSSRCPP